ncbi:integrin alpha [Myxococcota bacterium]|nr:integrin alpha [Myxococcota bacterium]
MGDCWRSNLPSVGGRLAVSIIWVLAHHGSLGCGEGDFPEEDDHGGDDDVGYPHDGYPASMIADAIFVGENPGDRAGISVAGVGDVSGDGIPDILVTALNFSASPPSKGRAYFILGPIAAGQRTLGGASDIILDGEEDGGFGYQVAPIGDLDGDGLGELMITGGTLGPASYVVWAPLGAGTYGIESVSTLIIEDGYKQPGELAVEVGDVTGDGVPDFIVDEDSNGYLFTSFPRVDDTPITSASTRFVLIRGGTANRVPVDLNSDGVSDIVFRVGSTSSDGPLAFLGPIPAGEVWADDADMTVALEDDGEYVSIYPLGDIDGDGNDDLAITRPDVQHHILYGPFDGPVIDFRDSDTVIDGRGDDPDDSDFWGMSPVPVGDVNGDGTSDFAFRGANNGYGAVFLVYGPPPTGTHRLQDLADRGGYSGDAYNADFGPGGTGFGDALSALGDVTGDGIDDFAVGAPDGSGNPGSVFIFFGR